MECAARARLERGLGQRLWPLLNRQLIEIGDLIELFVGKIVLEGALCPETQALILQLGELEPLQRATIVVDTVARHQRDLEVFFLERVWPHVVRVSEGREDLVSEGLVV